MLSTYVSREAAQKLRRGVPWTLREEIVRVEGAGAPGDPAQLLDEDGQVLGLGDVDLSSRQAVRRLGLPDDSPEGVIPRQLRRALERRLTLVQDPRYCRVVNDDGDGLPGLVVDRFDAHFVVQTFTRAMDARLEAITRALVELAGVGSVLLRNDGPARARAGLPRARAHVLSGAPPRWLRVHELGARLTIDLFQGAGTGYPYAHRRVRQVVARLSRGARVLDPCCSVGGLFVHAGLSGARQVIAFDPNADSVELARENVEANGLLGRARIEVADTFRALDRLQGPFDLVLLDGSELAAGSEEEDPLLRLLRLGLRHTRHGGHLIAIGAEALEERVALACQRERRVAFRLARPELPFDFPTVIGALETMTAVALEVT